MTRRLLYLVPLLCAPIFIAGLGATGLGEPDEGRNAEVGREMLETKDFVTPHLNAAVYLDKPPVFFWAVAASVAIFGVNEMAARLPSALSAIAGIALTVWFARRWFGERVAWLAGVLLAATPLYVVFARLVIFDMMLMVCTTTSTILFFEAMESERPGPGPALLGFAAAAVGTITKGPVALVVPLLVALTWAAVSRRVSLLKRLRFGTGMPVYLALVLPWALLAESRNPGFLSYALLGENLARMTANPYETTRPFYFYAHILVPGLFPWIVLAGVEGIAALFSRARGKVVAEAPAPAARAARFVVVWLGVLIVFFSAISSKRPSYVLPCALPVAILAARLLVSGSLTEPARSRRAAGAVVCAAATLLLAGVAIVKPPAMALPAPLLVATATALGVAAVILLAIRRSASPGLFAAAAALPLLALLPLAVVASRQIETDRSSREVSRFLAEHLRPEDRVVCFEEFRPGLNYYLQRPIHQVTRAGRIFTSNYIAAHRDTLQRTDGFRLMSSDDLREALAASGFRTYVLSPEKEYGLLLGMAGRPLERVWESGGFGLFVAAENH
jgi:4-amino-4-deoxy-L-arabinose transferase-like glycosyltransferase